MRRILLYSDEPTLEKGLGSVLRQLEGFELLPTCGSLASIMEQIAQGAPELVLMDLTPEVTFAVLSHMKRVMADLKIVLWVDFISTELAFQAMGLGVQGILRKTLPTALQVKCLEKVLAGELWFEKGLTDSFLCARRVALKRHEGQFVSLLSQGKKNKEIAAALMITEATVEVYLSRLFQKVGVKDRLELALFGLKHLAAELASGTVAIESVGHTASMDSVPPMEHAGSELTASRLPIGQAFSASEQRVGSRVTARRAIQPRATEFYATISHGLTARLLAELKKSRYIDSGSYAQAVQPGLAIRPRASGGKGKAGARPVCTDFQKRRTVYEVSMSMEDVQALMVKIKAELDRLYHAAQDGMAVEYGAEELRAA